MSEKFIINLKLDSNNIEPYYLKNELSLILYLENVLRKELNSIGLKLEEFNFERLGE